jgi:8-amino-7-oxononanoate synthase
MPRLRDVALEQLALARARSLCRVVEETERHPGARVRRGGRQSISFCCNDYLGLTHHPAVIEAARNALIRHGTGAGASRLVTGSHPLYAELERRLAELKGTEDALVFSSGYLTNLGVIPVLVGKDDLVLADRLCHASMYDGARLSGATLMRYQHLDIEECSNLLETHRAEFRRCLLLTETVFSMDGDIGPVAKLTALARAHDAWLLTDDAHGLGIRLSDDVLGATPGSADAADVQLGTLSKATASLGGYVCGSAELIAWLKNGARSVLFSTALPPASVAAATAALRIIREDPALLAKPLENARRFTAALGRRPAQSPIVPVVLGDPERALAAAAMLARHGFLVVAIRPPTVPAGTSRLRFTFSALHEAEPIERAAALLLDHGYA